MARYRKATLLVLLMDGLPALAWTTGRLLCSSLPESKMMTFQRSRVTQARRYISMNIVDMFTDKVVREGANLAGNVGWGVVEGAKLVGKGVVVAAPIVGKGLKTAVDFSLPYVQRGVETASPLVQEYATKAIDAVTPVVQEYASKTLEAATPVAQQAADDAMAALQPYLEAGQRIPSDLLEQAKASAGVERVESFVNTASQTKSGLAGGLRSVAAILDGNPPEPAASPSPVVTPLVPKRGFIDINAGIQSQVEAQRAAAMAPIVKFEKDLMEKATRFAELTAAGIVGLAFVKRYGIQSRFFAFLQYYFLFV